ncbi:bifunctional TVP38/TMEM64 family protein/FAD-dependent oxidoreductase [Sessilibacter sp. MAH1]
MKKIIIVIAIAILVGLFFAFDGTQYLSVEGIKNNVDTLQAWRAESALTFAIIFFTVYVITTALSVPGAALLTLAAGALFGFWWGVLIASFASSLGATLAFLASRYVLGESIQSKFGDRLSSINKGIERDGAFYLLTLRLVPAFPFFLVNLLMGLTPIKTITYYWVSQIGMLAGTAIYVNAGTQLAQIESAGDILSTELFISFFLLGIFPLIAKAIVSKVNAAKVYKKWSQPKKFDRNMIVIGAGAAGLVSSYIAAAVKAKVTLIENHKMGGDCLNYGCVPSKALIKSARVAKQMRNAENYGLEAVEPKFSFRKIMARVQQVVKDIEPHDSVERYESLGVDVKLGHGKLVDPWTVEITDKEGKKSRLTARSIVIAAGAAPLVPRIPGLEETGYLTSDTLWEVLSDRDTPPEKLIVLGGGPIGCELTQAFARLGANVTQIEMAPRILLKEDEDVAELVTKSLLSDGVNLLTDHKAVGAELVTEGETKKKYLIVEANGETKRIEFDEIICALGRMPRLSGYGLEELGVNTNRTVSTNEYLQTVYPNIYAAGDVAGPYQFTHTAAHQAWYAAVNGLFGQFKKFKADYSVIPWTTFTDPEVARVGLSEQDAKEQGIAYQVTRYGIDDLDRAIAESEAHGFVKVLTVPGKDKILGVTIVGEHAGELLAEFVTAMKWKLGLNKILGTIHTYPTWSESNKYAAGEWKRANQPKKLLELVEKYHNWRLG